MAAKIRLKQLPGLYAISRLEPGASVPGWADGPGFVSITRTEDELSIVCLQDRVPDGVKRDDEWVAFKLQGPFAFDETGIVLSIIRPLSENELGIFVVSTFDGDHLLVKAADRVAATRLLGEAGHTLL
ncbi:MULTISPECIES: ACT domain-containing protein [unclassified Mesorhizobium]|uniref:ACT domain-containing protein n=1 Tax=unclassified Mesorhizobium TaxID=325217 RepID=UPI00112A4BAA|nr:MULTISPECIES: ACT domain-containing protein [unclassified Mesorhizobium]TPJ48710.1 ACT domain-containing protein [Mesorhizobium sp. B2-6-6]MBZ9959708.1 ACT domain-containing protein [Mesorhizobium sp. BR1-1-14]MBZ9983164.1 ACT domain-containing protein [Mesorhizobium sp. BR-1-1-8]MCA0000033.1 ACT domain-containing protein [Mesorhizobium sp. B264B2A]MCA0006084.1 ACT domain-containing protein [Mesorhizobium sp. B264B1B]